MYLLHELPWGQNILWKDEGETSSKAIKGMSAMTLETWDKWEKKEESKENSHRYTW